MTTAAPSTMDRRRMSAMAVVCRKCGNPYRSQVPFIVALRGRVDREVRCPSCNTLAAIWSSSTGEN